MRKQPEKLIAVLKKGSAKKLDAFFMKGHEGHDHTKMGCAKTVWYREMLPNSKYRNVFGILRIPKEHGGANLIYFEAVVDEEIIVGWRVYEEVFKRLDTAKHEISSIEELREGTVEEIIDIATNETAFSAFNKEFKAFYGIDVDYGLVLSRYTYGACGYEGWLEPKYKAVGEVLGRGDIASFEKWLRSGNMELQLYAMEGFKEAGSQFSSETLKIMEFVLSLDAPIAHCRGCSVELSTFQAIAKNEGFFELLKRKM